MFDGQYEITEGTSLADYVYNKVKVAILCGELKPEQRIREIPLSNELGVSRTPVRKAMQRLEEEQFIVTAPGCGAKVAGISLKAVKDAFDTCRTIEIMACTLICNNYEKNKISPIRDAYSGMKQAMERNDIQELYHNDCLFHLNICKASGNLMLPRIMIFLESQMKRYKFEYLRQLENGKIFLEEYGNILDAIESANENTAVSLIDSYFSKIQNKLQ